LWIQPQTKVRQVQTTDAKFQFQSRHKGT
jgi:hypothetical protein